MARDDQTAETGVPGELLVDLSRVPCLQLVWESTRAVSVPARPLFARPLTLGRAPSCGLVVDDGQVSRDHASVGAHAEGAWVEDHGSRHGTFVDGVRVAGRSQLHEGSVLRVGNSFFVLTMRSPVAPEELRIDGLDGDAESMVLLRRAIGAVAPTPARVLVLGETGTGKEATAQAIHRLSGRAGAFVPVNCAAIPESLAESQLFGHVRGAFTDARADHAGYFRAADGGTLFLDEIGELSPMLQAKLLRALEGGGVVPVGGTREHRVDVRFVAATHRNLASEVDAGRFRGDLYARVAEYTIATVPLREHREDILPMLERALGPSAPPLGPDLVGALLVHPYRFNARELFAIARQLMVDGASAERLETRHAGPRLEQDRASSPAIDRSLAVDPPASREPMPTRERLEQVLRETKGNVSETARVLGRSRRQIHRYLESYGLGLDVFRG